VQPQPAGVDAAMTKLPTDDSDVVHDTDQSRYEIYDGSALAGFAEYTHEDGVVTFTHTEIEPAFEGKGLASRLIKAALDDVRRSDLRAVPVCPFVAAFVRHHSEYRDLVQQRTQGTG
jgi:predicted GNAT family acetyltransferase